MTRRQLGRVVLLVAVVFLPTTVRAQGTVSGLITLEEPKTSARRDVGTAIVFLEPATRPARFPKPTGELASVSIGMRGRVFVPHVQLVQVGGEVAFPNQDPFSHNVFSNSELGAFDLGLYRRGATRSATFPRPGVYPIYCNIHASMVTFVIAVSTRAFARVRDDGTFTIPNVPAGAYRLHVWHERAPELMEPITVAAGGTGGLRVTLDTRAFPHTAHLDKFGKPYPAARADRY
jgi:plastocyanin